MQTPTEKTPIEKLIRLGDFHLQMLQARREHAPDLHDRLVSRVQPRAAELEALELEVHRTERGLIGPRVRLRLWDHHADSTLRKFNFACQTADGGKPGKLTKTYLPGGLSQIVPLFATSEIQEIRRLEALLTANPSNVATEWLPILTAVRTEYETRVNSRNDAVAALGAKRALRNQARRAFVTVYKANQGAIKEAFPDDKDTQELYFDALQEDDASETAKQPDPSPTPAPKP